MLQLIKVENPYSITFSIRTFEYAIRCAFKKNYPKKQVFEKRLDHMLRIWEPLLDNQLNDRNLMSNFIMNKIFIWVPKMMNNVVVALI
jgi:hypothetical protein